jgi:hypothetical protein
MVTPYTFDITRIIELKKKVDKTIAKIKETKTFAEKNPALKSILNPEALVTPPLYLDMLQLKLLYKIKIPINKEKPNHETILKVEKDIDVIDARCRSTYNFHIAMSRCEWDIVQIILR